MKTVLTFLFFQTICLQLVAQTFTRSELSTSFFSPFEITYGQDGYLWLTEWTGKVTRVHPETGEKDSIYQAADYFDSSPLESHSRCHLPTMKAGTLGLALHPDFPKEGSNYIYYVYSYNSGTDSIPSTKFRVKRLTWDATTKQVIGEKNIINNINSSFDHLGGRLIAVKQNNEPYLFLSIGDHGLSEINDPDCYEDQSENPNNKTQDPYTVNGKIHRFRMDGSIPEDNPIAGNSFYSRGHRNPQGLAYNDNLEILYAIEHGDRTDDEINLIEKGMNYGWRDVRGYNDDNNYEGESDYVANYTPHSDIPNDRLVGAMYSWCAEPAASSPTNLGWCTVAPSDGIYYGSSGIPQWQNSLLVVTLKKSTTLSISRAVYQFKLLPNGQLAPSTALNPNPKKFFEEDQNINGRLRDIAISPDGKKIYLINNHGAPTNKITVYTVDESSLEAYEATEDACIQLFPNPTSNVFEVKGLENFEEISHIQLTSIDGKYIKDLSVQNLVFDVSDLTSGVYVFSVFYKNGICNSRFVKE